MPQDQNSSFLTSPPYQSLQFAWDSVSLGALKTCPRYYQLSILEGWTPRRESVHLTFGLLYHSALEHYDHYRAEGQSHESATREALRWLLTETWDPVLKRPWASDDSNKNRLTLVRTVIWYLDQFENDPLETIILSNGKPAVELSFRWETSYEAPDGSKYILCGHLDRLVSFQDQTYVADRKTTKQTINQSFFDKFSPDNQMSGYALGGKMTYNLPIQGIIIDGAQIAVTFSRFQRGFVTRTEAQLIEWYSDLRFWFDQAESFAYKAHWPMNDKACSMYGGCPFRGTCAKDPRTREMWMKVDFAKRTWDPLQVRGDI